MARPHRRALTHSPSLEHQQERSGNYHLLGLHRYSDHTSADASAWVRAYSAFLNDFLEAFPQMIQLNLRACAGFFNDGV
jgi:hypothetical protein